MIFQEKPLFYLQHLGEVVLEILQKSFLPAAMERLYKEGKLFNGDVSDEKVKQWAESVLL